MRLHCIWVLILGLIFAGEAQEKPKLLFLLVDGLKWDFLQADMTGLQAMAAGGVKAEYTTPEFPSVSTVNWMSILSGQHPESHGLINNEVYDEEKDVYMTINKTDVQWANALPIYTWALLNNLKVDMYYWDPCSVPLLGVTPNCVKPGIPSPGPSMEQFEQAAFEAIQNLKEGTTDFAVTYLELIDVYGHFYGPGSVQLENGIRDLDVIIARILELVDGHDINVVLASDHGMTDVTPEKSINISKVLKPEDVKAAVVSPPIAFIWPKEDNFEEVYEKVRGLHPNMKAYLKEDLLTRWHFKKHQRVPPITLVADLGWSIIETKGGYPTHNNVTYYTGFHPILGYHGYDNIDPDMRGSFMAIGPDFKKGYKQAGFPLVDIYLVVSKALRIEPLPNNGTWSNVQNMFLSEEADPKSPCPDGCVHGTRIDVKYEGSEDPWGWGFYCVCNQGVGGKCCDLDDICNKKPCPEDKPHCVTAWDETEGRYCYSK